MVVVNPDILKTIVPINQITVAETKVQKEAVIVREGVLSPHQEVEAQHRRGDIPPPALVDPLLERRKRIERRKRTPKSLKNLVVFTLESRTGWIQIEL